MVQFEVAGVSLAVELGILPTLLVAIQTVPSPDLDERKARTYGCLHKCTYRCLHKLCPIASLATVGAPGFTGCGKMLYGREDVSGHEFIPAAKPLK